MIIIKKFIIIALTLIIIVLFLYVKEENDKNIKTYVNSYDVSVEFVLGEGKIVDFLGKEYKNIKISYSKGNTIVDILTLNKYNLDCENEFVGWFTEDGYLWNFDEDVIRYNIKLYAKYSG